MCMKRQKWQLEDDAIRTSKVPVNKEISQGDSISPKVFTIALEHILKTSDGLGDIKNYSLYLSYIRFTDDIVLVNLNLDGTKTNIEKLEGVSAVIGLEKNIQNKSCKNWSFHWIHRR